MESYTVKIAPGVTETVMATSPEEARRKVRILIADKGTRNIYDKLYFDYDTGVNKRGIRRKLAQAEISKRGDERELVLDRIVGSGGHVKNTKGQIAITPTGMRELGLEVPKIKLADGTVLEQNTVVDEKGFDLRNDLADFAGVAGPIAGAIGMMRPGSRVLEFFKNTPRFGRMAGASIGSAGGLGVGDISAEGIITYGSLDVLTKATTFEVSFITVDGGGTQVSWGSSGNAFAAGVGDGFGVFGGSGGWTNVG